MSFFSSIFGAGAPSTIDGPTARKLVAEGALLVDVRTPGEYADGHVDGAQNVPVETLPGGAAGLPKDKVVVVYCRSGGRSARAAGILRGEGFATVHDLGPISAW
jgi:rhodanese-related sulfurtransferase